jgi:hypothetical protein
MAKNKSPFQYLSAAVDEILVPHIYLRGFEDDERDIWKDDKRKHLSIRFLRWRGSDLDLLEIQYDKRHRPKFAVECGVAPSDGIDYCGYHYSQTSSSVHITNRVRLHPNRLCPLWRFGFPLIKVPLIRNPSAQDIANQVVRLFPQVEEWLRNGVKGPNMAVIGVPGNNSKVMERKTRDD